MRTPLPPICRLPYAILYALPLLTGAGAANARSDATFDASSPVAEVAEAAAMARIETAGGARAPGATLPHPHADEAAVSDNDPAEPDVTLVLRSGEARLSTALAEFTRDHGWELAWEIDRDFPIDHAARFEGPFLDIIAAVVGSLRKTDAPVRAKIYRANKVVRIVHATR